MIGGRYLAQQRGAFEAERGLPYEERAVRLAEERRAVRPPVVARADGAGQVGTPPRQGA